MSKVVLSCSLLANAVLALLIAREFAMPPDPWQPVDVPGRSAGAVTAPRSAAAEPAAASPGASGRDGRSGLETTSPARYYAALRSLGLGEEDAKTLVLATLRRQIHAELEPPADEYWRVGPEARLEHAVTVIDADQRVRRRLLDTFGASAASDPSFAELFRPLDPYLTFLSSAEQQALQRLRLEHQRAAATAQPRAAAEALSGVDRARAGDVVRPDLSSVLRPESLLEYELRESPLASRLRSATSGLSEEAFRDAFVLLRSMHRGGGLRDHLEARAELERMLGTRAFLRLWSTRDPVFRAVAAVAEDRGWSEQTTTDAYSLLVRLDEQLLTAVDASGSDPAAVSERLRELEAGVAAQLTDLVGDGGAEALLRARRSRFFPVDEAGIPPESADGRR